MTIDYASLLHKQNTGIIRLRTDVYIHPLNNEIQQDIFFFPKTLIESSNSLKNRFNIYRAILASYYSELSSSNIQKNNSVKTTNNIKRYSAVISGCSLNLKTQNLENRLKNKNIFFITSQIPDLYGVKYSLILDNVDKHISDYFQNNPSAKLEFLSNRSKNKTLPALSILENITTSLM